MEGYAEVRKGRWIEEEDNLLRKCIEKHGEGKWSEVPLNAGLNRCRKSCRLRWLNYLKPDIKRGKFSDDESDLIIILHKLLGNRWKMIADKLPGRTDNDIKNYWKAHIFKKLIIKNDGKKKGISEDSYHEHTRIVNDNAKEMENTCVGVVKTRLTPKRLPTKMRNM